MTHDQLSVMQRCSCGGTNFREIASPDGWHEQVRPVFRFILETILVQKKEEKEEQQRWACDCQNGALFCRTQVMDFVHLEFTEDVLLTLVTISICTIEISYLLNVHTPIQPINKKDHFSAGHYPMPTRIFPPGASNYLTVDSLHTK